MTPVQPIRPAATVILVRDAAVDYEIFMLKRTSKAAFAGGMYVFPGGRVDGDDHLHKYDSVRVGPSEPQQAQAAALGFEWRGYWIAGIRESFEEAGLLLAYTEDGELLSYDDVQVRTRLDGYRGPLHSGELSLFEICQRENLKLAVDRIHFYNRLQIYEALAIWLDRLQQGLTWDQVVHQADDPAVTPLRRLSAGLFDAGHSSAPPLDRQARGELKRTLNRIRFAYRRMSRPSNQKPVLALLNPQLGQS